MTKNKLSRYFVIVSILTFVAIFFQIVQQSYSNLIKPTQEVQQNPLIRSVNPKLDVQVLDEIEKRQELNP
jgi:dipeptide/tripeptide permease